MPHFRLRFSLFTAILLMTIVGLAISVTQLWREVGPLRAEVHRLRDEVGVLVVEDKTKIYAIRVNTRDELTWKWRVWLPAGKTAIVHCTDAVAPGSSSGSGSISLRDSGENVVEFRIDKDRRSDKWNGSLYADSGSVGKYEQQWVGWSATSTNFSGVGTKTESFEPGKQIELIRCVVTENASSGKSKPNSKPAGFRIWVDTN